MDCASRAEKEPGSRLPAAALCLGRHAHPAGRSPNSSSLFLPQAAVVAVAVRIHPCVPLVWQIKQKLRYPLDTGVLGGRGWIRTTEAESSRFTVCPHWPLGNTPIFFFVHPFAGRLVYFSMRNGFCQLPFFTFFGNAKRTGSFRFRLQLSLYAKGAAAQDLVQQPLFYWFLISAPHPDLHW